MSYQDTISKPAFVRSEERTKEREVFLNGEVAHVYRKKEIAFGQFQEKPVKKTVLCLKGLMVDDLLGREAIKNYYNM